MNYIKRHWHGEHPLAIAFWINFLALFVVIYFAEKFTQSPFVQGETRVTYTAVGYFILTRLIIYPWQIVGVIRSCDRYAENNTDRIWAIAAQAVVIMSIVAIISSAFSSYQAVLAYQQRFAPPELMGMQPKYTFNLVNNGELVHLQGPMEVGISRSLAGFLKASKSVKGIVLDSGGGHIYEGRGLARVIRENKLDTYTLSECASACTTAFIAGKTRILGSGAKLGFHQYKSYTVVPNIDMEAEQSKDRVLFEAQGISDAFLHKIFNQPPEKMWWPAEAVLLDAGVIHQTGFTLNN